MGINQANANGNHQAVVPDGKLCSGNNPTFRGLDLERSDWQTTPIQPDANGKFTFVFKATAPHATRWSTRVLRRSSTQARSYRPLAASRATLAMPAPKARIPDLPAAPRATAVGG